MTFYLVPIVEGQTEVGCVERLLQRVWTELLAAPVRLQVLPASRGKRDTLINPDHPDFAAKVEEAYAKLARRLRRLGQPAYLDVPVVVSARRYERLGWPRVAWMNWRLRRQYRRDGEAGAWAAYRRYYRVE